MVSNVATPRRTASGVVLVQLAITAVYVALPGAANDARLLYVAVGPVAAYCLRPIEALAHAVLVGLLLALALGIHGGERDILAQIWLTTIATVLAVTGLVAAIAASVRRQVRQMGHDATHDPLTGLANRTLLSSATTTALDRLHATGRGQVFMILIDLDRFKLLNDTHGHHAGDQLLTSLSRRLVRCAPAGSLVGRLGGDEFAILVDDPSGRLAPTIVAAEIAGAWAEPIPLDRGAVRTSGCLGVAVAAGTDDTSELLRHVDAAMYRAKAEGRSGICVYDIAQQVGIERRLVLEQALFDAIGNGELSIVFQPIVDLDSGWVHAAEALARWTHPDLGPVDPAEFIPIAETSGMIDPIGLWIADGALRQVAQWRATGVVHADFTVHVNLSGKQLHGAFAEQIGRLLDLHGLEPTALMMELTESVLMRAGDAEADVLWALDQLGVPLALDDFGTGFSSLSYLLQANVHTVKIDRSFVSGMSTDPTRQAIVATVVGLARASGSR